MQTGQEFFNQTMAHADFLCATRDINAETVAFLRLIRRAALTDMEKSLLVHIALEKNFGEAVKSIHQTIAFDIGHNILRPKEEKEERRLIAKKTLHALKKIFEEDHNSALSRSQSIVGNVPDSVKTYFWDKGLLFNELENKWFTVKSKLRANLKKSVDINHIPPVYLPLYELALQTHVATQQNERHMGIQIEFNTLIYIVSLLDADKDRAIKRLLPILKKANHRGDVHNGYIDAARLTIERFGRMLGIRTRGIDYPYFLESSQIKAREGYYPIHLAQHHLFAAREQGLITTEMHDVFNILLQPKPDALSVLAKNKDLHPSTPAQYYAMISQYLEKEWSLPEAPPIDHLKI